MTQLTLPSDPKWRHSGVDITYVKSRNVLYIGGWYDSYVGIPSTEMSVPEFCEKLGITAKDGKAWLAPDKARVDVTFIVPDKRRRDKTNFASAFKAGLDGLVDAGVIVDDSYEHIDDQYHIVYEKGKSMTIVEVTE